MIKAVRWIFRIVFLIVFLSLLALGAGLLWLRTSLPQLNGTITVVGLSAPVEVLRDKHGIPHISAKTDADAFFALGVVHAQDRLWQMEINRRAASGRLSEVFGSRMVSSDRFLRTMGFAKAAESGAKTLWRSDVTVRGVMDSESGSNLIMRCRRSLSKSLASRTMLRLPRFKL